MTPNYLQQFQTSIKRLNPRQQEAVDTIEGPVMVLAGPGTGKTQILTLRIANILLKTDTEPDNILALTFTDAAATNMKRRLVNMIGSRGYYVPVFTFHGLCNQIIQSYPEYFPRIIGGQSVDAITQADIIANIIEQNKFQKLKPFGNKFYYLKNISSQIQEFKREAKSPTDIKKIADLEAKHLATLEDELPKGKFITATTQVIKNNELAFIYEQYQAELNKRHLYDYEDMILETVKALGQNQNLLHELQEIYQYILVDEHQDTNNSQNQVVELLSSFYDRPNLFIVGDDKQAIYRFQGASLDSFKYFQNKFKDVKLITLDTNYRSTQSILDASQSLIGFNANTITAPLKSVASELNPVTVVTCTNPHEEHRWLAEDIKHKIKEGIDPTQIGILFRNNQDAFPIADMLERYQIPFQIESNSNLLHDPDIKKIILLFEAIADLEDQTKLIPALHIDFFKLEPLAIYQVLNLRRQLKKSIPVILNNPDLLKDNNVIGADEIKKVFTKLSIWHRQGFNEHLTVLFERLVRESGFLEHVLASKNPTLALNKLSSLFDEIKKASSHRPDYRLADFINWLNLIRDHNLSLKSNTYLQPNAVRLMTAHRAKGLEFNSVYITGAYDGHWGNKRINNPLKFPLEPELASTTKNEDERRLFYVCLTRGQKNIYITHASISSEGKDQNPTQFITEIPANLKTFISPHLPPLDTPDQIFGPIKSIIKPNEQTFLRELFIEQGLSVTALNNYLKCPWAFFYQNLLRVPSVKTPPAAFGTAVHMALNNFFTKYRQDNSADLNFILNEFELALRREHLTPQDYDRILKKGQEILPIYYKHNLPTWNFNTLNEIKIDTNLTDSDIKLTGLIDKVEFNNDSQTKVTVIDYKTGKPRSRNEIIGATKNSEGNYFRQLVFYKLLLDESPKNMIMEQGILDFIEPMPSGSFKQEAFSISDDDTKALTELIKTTWNDITNFKFWDKTCDDKDCTFCYLRRLSQK